jgi:hypothetical protein
MALLPQQLNVVKLSHLNVTTLRPSRVNEATKRSLRLARSSYEARKFRAFIAYNMAGRQI